MAPARPAVLRFTLAFGGLASRGLAPLLSVPLRFRRFFRRAPPSEASGDGSPSDSVGRGGDGCDVGASSSSLCASRRSVAEEPVSRLADPASEPSALERSTDKSASSVVKGGSGTEAAPSRRPTSSIRSEGSVASEGGAHTPAAAPSRGAPAPSAAGVAAGSSSVARGASARGATARTSAVGGASAGASSAGTPLVGVSSKGSKGGSVLPALAFSLA